MAAKVMKIYLVLYTKTNIEIRYILYNDIQYISLEMHMRHKIVAKIVSMINFQIYLISYDFYHRYISQEYTK